MISGLGQKTDTYLEDTLLVLNNQSCDNFKEISKNNKYTHYSHIDKFINSIDNPYGDRTLNLYVFSGKKDINLIRDIHGQVLKEDAIPDIIKKFNNVIITT